jgi:hypothetical protein
MVFEIFTRQFNALPDEDVLRTKMTKNSFDYYQYLYKKFLHACPVSKCDNCGAFKISLKNDKGVKVFQQRPSGARLKQVWARGIRYPDVLAKESQEVCRNDSFRSFLFALPISLTCRPRCRTTI